MIDRTRLPFSFTTGGEVRDGIAVEFHPDGWVKRVARYSGGELELSLEVDPARDYGIWRTHGGYAVGEVYSRGSLETLSPWSDNEASRPTEQKFESWLQEKLALFVK